MAEWSALLDPMVQYFKDQYEFYYEKFHRVNRLYDAQQRRMSELRQVIRNLQHEAEYFAEREERLFQIIRSFIATSTRENIDDFMEQLHPVARTLFADEILEGYSSEETVLDLTFMEYQ